MNQPIQQITSNIGRDDAGPDFAPYLDFIFDNRWLIARIALVAALLGVLYAFLAKPVYEANILIQVEDSNGAPKNNILGELSSAFDLKTATAAEMEVLRSRLVVSRAVENSRLYISVRPDYFPVIGAWMARRNKQLSDPGLFGYGGYVWGAERAAISIFNIPEELEGTPFVLTAEGNGNFRLTQGSHRIDIRGRAGDTVRFRDGPGEIELRVDQLAARPGAQFSLIRSPRLEITERLQNGLKILERGKQSGIISVALEGDDSKITSDVLNEIGREYIRQNVDRKSEEAEKTLAFLNKQLPDIKQELERSETKYNELRNSRGTIDLGEEGRNILHQSVSAQTKMIELKQKKEELLTRFTNEHPIVDAVNQQMRELAREQAGITAKIKGLPAVEQDVLRLTRDVKVNTEVYTSLLNTAQQLRLVEGRKVGNARLLDIAAKPVKPVKPKRLIVILLAGLLGLFLGILFAYIRKTLYGGINDPRKVEHLLGLPVCATIPHSDSQDRLYAQIQGTDQKVSVLPHEAPSDGVIESLRSFRSSLQFAMIGAKNNIIMITGPTPAVGKSFVSANFAAVLASTGKRVLLIDADMRTGYLNRYFGVPRKNGLSEAIASKIFLDHIIHREVVEGVDFISTGHFPPKPAELLAHSNFDKLLRLFSARYDYVLIDTAPVLAFSDALIVGTLAGAIYDIVRGGVSSIGEIEESVKRMNQAGLTVTGVVFNDLKRNYIRYGYGLKYGADGANSAYQRKLGIAGARAKKPSTEVSPFVQTVSGD